MALLYQQFCHPVVLYIERSLYLIELSSKNLLLKNTSSSIIDQAFPSNQHQVPTTTAIPTPLVYPE
jgi:hypothetical protein